MSYTGYVPERCPDCDLPHTWGGMGWRAHSARYHADMRRLYLATLARQMRRRWCPETPEEPRG